VVREKERAKRGGLIKFGGAMCVSRNTIIGRWSRRKVRGELFGMSGDLRRWGNELLL